MSVQKNTGEVQHSSEIKKQSRKIVNVKSFLFINMIELIIKGQQQTYWLVK